MKDSYPHDTALPVDALVPPDRQPDYSDLPEIDLQSTNVGECLADRNVSLGRGDLVAAIDAHSGRMLTFADLAAQSTVLAAGLRRYGIRVGDRIAYRAPNIAEVLVVMIAVWKVGAVLVPTPAHARSEELRFFLEDTTPRLLFVHAGSLNDSVHEAVAGSSLKDVFIFGAENADGRYKSWDELQTAADTLELTATPGDQVAIIWHTGGTTGRPKGCYHTHKRFLSAGYSYGQAAGAAPGQRWAATAPIGHALGLIHYTIFTLLHGATVVFIEDFARPQAVLTAVEQWKITTLTGLMATWARMLEVLERERSYSTVSLKRCYAMWQSASSAEIFDKWRLRGVELLNNFGSTAFANWVLIPRPDETVPRTALGKPAPGYRVEAVEVVNGKVVPLYPQQIGQMAVKGPTGLTYWNRPDMQRRDVVDGWTLSDDLIQFDDGGNAMYMGRTDYMISTAGHKVAPVEVEEVLSRHHSVREVAVVPAPCPVRQEVVAAFISLNPGTMPSEALKIELRDFAKARLSSYKSPRRIEFVDALPRDTVGKVQTRLIKEKAALLLGPDV
jgi:2-aminobenzoate-CoA ligase